ncbi:hypothetical protein EDB92DRAFT_397678 [Lactarius akahatsu]|uniref:C2 domain-containing protein n=1 Tax=Lactarius akahatsu TaxID=416441 RepID=A0AAD4LIH3_9AGAM|nr:hypothetical protein EDB92DRAFT_397678 [Lactarius akahatsu]
MAAARDLEHGQMSSNSRRPSPSRNPGRGPRDAEPQEGPSQFRVDVTVLRAENVPRLKNVFRPKFFVTVASQATEKKTASVPAKRRTARWGESLGAFILQPSTPLILRLYAERFARRNILIGAGWRVGDALFDSQGVTEHNFRWCLCDPGVHDSYSIRHHHWL